MEYLLLVLVALAVGSFLNVVIYRFPIIIEQNCRLDCEELLNIKPSKKEKISLSTPRSFCPACKKPIPVSSNIPLVSYCLQSGKCCHCDAKISFQYPLVELLTVVLWVLSAIHFGFNLTLIPVLVFISLIISLFFIDINHHLLPDELTLSLLWIGLIVNTQELFSSLSDAVFGAVGAYMILWLLTKAFYLITGKQGMGHGDFKLFAALGAWFGWLMLPLMLLFASVCGVIIGIIYLKATHQDKNTPIPFGPFLCFTSVLTLFYGHKILIWYMGSHII